jgi:phage recombination protein Bet
MPPAPAQRQDIVFSGPRLPMPVGFSGGPDIWKILTDIVFPAAKDPNVIALAVAYARERNLDILKKPFHIVPTWSSQLRRDVETIWPAITEIQITAHRTGLYAGMDPATYGPMKKEIFKGRRRVDNNWENVEVVVEYPEYCEVTVYRIVGGHRQPFTERVYWKECYGRVGGGLLPNDMWQKRPHLQLAKCAKAAALRAAFPEEGPGYDEAELQGVIQTQAASAAPTPAPAAAATADTAWKPPADEATDEPPADDDPPVERPAPELIVAPATADGSAIDWTAWGTELMQRLNSCTSAEKFEGWLAANSQQVDSMKGEAPKVHARLAAAIAKAREAKGWPAPATQPVKAEQPA